jgi:flagellar biosynthetic protein FliR
MDLLAELQHLLGTLGFHVSIQAFLVLFGLALTRIATAVTLTPFLGGQAVGPNIKVGLSVAMTVVLLPGLSVQQQPEISVPAFVALMIKEAMIGVTIGFLTQLILYAVQVSGALIDTMRGLDQPGLTTPQLPSNVSALGLLQFQVALVIFLSLNGHLLFLRALARSFDQLPLFSFPRLASPELLAEEMGRISGQVFVIALQLGAPILVTLFLVDVLFGIFGKMAPQININQESQPVKALIGLVMLILSVGFVFTRLDGVLSQMLWNISTILSRIA